MRKFLSFLFGMCVLLCPVGQACAQNVVAMFVPGLDFPTGSERNQFVNKIASILSDKTGESWEGQAFARASDFEAARNSINVAILDADYFSSRGGELKPVAMLSSDGKTKRAMKVLAKKGDSNKLYHYQHKHVVIPTGTSMGDSFISGAVLGNEAKASSYFSKIEEVRDVRSAINAVQMGKADLTVVFDGYDSGMTSIYTTSPVGLPVIAYNPSRVQNADKIKGILQNMSVSTSFISGSAPYNASDAGAYKQFASSKKSVSINYQPIESEHGKVKVTTVSMRDRTEGIPLNSNHVGYTPTTSDIDFKLEQRL